MKIAVYRPFFPPWEMAPFEVLAERHQVDFYIGGSASFNQYKPFLPPSKTSVTPLKRSSLPVKGRLRRIIYLTTYPDLNPLSSLTLRLLGGGYDIVHTVESGMYSSLQAFASSRLSLGRLKFVFTNWENIPRPHRFWHLRRLVIRYADAIVAPSGGARASLLVEGAIDSRIHMIPGGVDLDRFRPDQPNAIKEILGIGGGEVVILYVGRFVESKGLGPLLRAFATVSKDHPETRLVLVGEGPMGASLMSLAEELGVKDRTLITPPHPYSQVHRIHALSDITVLPSIPTPLWVEQFGYVLIEAMACGKPVVASRTGAIPEIVKEGETGLLAKPGDEVSLASSLSRLLEDADLRREMGRRGRERAEELYSHRKIADSYEALYQSLL